MKAKIFCLLLALENPHQALDAFMSFAALRKISYTQPMLSRTRSAYIPPRNGTLYVPILKTVRDVPSITHTHPFNGPLSRTTQVSWYQKGKTNLDFTETRAVASAGPYASLHLAPDR